MKKLFSSIICFCLLIVSAFTFAACSSEKVSIDDAADRVEEVQVAQTSFLSVLTEESVSDSRTPQEQGIMGATAEGFEMLAFLAYEVVLLDDIHQVSTWCILIAESVLNQRQLVNCSFFCIIVTISNWCNLEECPSIVCPI